MKSSKYKNAFYIIACFTDDECRKAERFISENIYTDTVQLYINISILDLRKRKTASAMQLEKRQQKYDRISERKIEERCKISDEKNIPMVSLKYDCKRMGIGRMLYLKLEEALKKQGVLNMNACIACAEEEDEFLPRDSVLFHTKMGFKQVVMSMDKRGYALFRILKILNNQVLQKNQRCYIMTIEKINSGLIFSGRDFM